MGISTYFYRKKRQRDGVFLDVL